MHYSPSTPSLSITSHHPINPIILAPITPPGTIYHPLLPPVINITSHHFPSLMIIPSTNPHPHYHPSSHYQLSLASSVIIPSPSLTPSPPTTSRHSPNNPITTHRHPVTTQHPSAANITTSCLPRHPSLCIITHYHHPQWLPQHLHSSTSPNHHTSHPGTNRHLLVKLVWKKI